MRDFLILLYILGFMVTTAFIFKKTNTILGLFIRFFLQYEMSLKFTNDKSINILYAFIPLIGGFILGLSDKYKYNYKSKTIIEKYLEKLDKQ